MGPIKDWITDPDVGLAFNLARAGTAGAQALRTSAPRNSQFDYFAQMQPQFDAALASQDRINQMEAADLEAQALAAEQETAATAEQKAREVDEFAQQQDLQFASSGVIGTVGYEDSWLKTLDRTRRLGQQEIDAIQKRGAAVSDLYRRRAIIGQAQGKTSLLGERIKYSAQQAQAQMLQSAQETKSKQMGASSFLSSLFDTTSSSKVKRQQPTPTTTAAPPGKTNGFLTPLNPKLP